MKIYNSEFSFGDRVLIEWEGYKVLVNVLEAVVSEIGFMYRGEELSSGKVYIFTNGERLNPEFESYFKIGDWFQMNTRLWQGEKMLGVVKRISFRNYCDDCSAGGTHIDCWVFGKPNYHVFKEFLLEPYTPTEEQRRAYENLPNN